MLTPLKWKVCGMRDEVNIKDVLTLKPDFMGFIFYPKSPRYVVGILDKNILGNFPSTTQKVGVFVNQSYSQLVSFGEEYHLDYFQLHGTESPELCKKIQEKGFKVIKAFSVGDEFDFEILATYLPFVNYFLFDTKAQGGYGGHGKKFNWNILQAYTYNIPYFLAGGIDLENVQNIHQLKETPLAVLDVNSKFEIEPGFKDIKKLQLLQNHLNHFNNNGF